MRTSGHNSALSASLADAFFQDNQTVSAVADISRASAAAPSSASLPIFYLNRDCDSRRRAEIAIELNRAGVAGERVCGVDGLSVPDSLRAYFFDGDGRYSAKLAAGEIGCYASHLKALQAVVDRKLAYALILEDDAVLPSDLTRVIAEIVAAVPEHWDLVHLCRDPCRAVKPVAQLEQSRQLIRYSRVPPGAVGYLISLAGARKFLIPVKRSWPVDTDFRRPWQFGLEIYGVTPMLIGHSDAGPSSILSLGERARGRRGVRLPTRQDWTGNPLHTHKSAFFNLTRLGLLWWVSCWLQNAGGLIARVFGWRSPLLKLSRDADVRAPLSRNGEFAHR